MLEEYLLVSENDGVENIEFRMVFEEALSTLTSREYQIINLTLQGFKQKEIGPLIEPKKISRTSVWQAKKIALQKLQEFLQDSGDPISVP